MIRSEKELTTKIADCTTSFDAKFAGTNGKRAIVICGGTGCLSSNSASILAKFEEAIMAHDLSDKVTVNKVGCFGFCSQGPFVKIFPEDTLYHGVKVEDVEEIVNTDLINHQIVERLLYVDPMTKKFKNKMKLTSTKNKNVLLYMDVV